MRPLLSATQLGHLQRIRKREAACAANDCEQIKTINHPVLQNGFYQSFIWDWLPADCQHVKAYKPCLSIPSSLWGCTHSLWNVADHTHTLFLSFIYRHSLQRFTVAPLSQCNTFVSGYFQKYKVIQKSVRVEEIDGVKLVKNLAVRMEEVFRKKAEATRVGRNYLEKKVFLYLFVSICWAD